MKILFLILFCFLSISLFAGNNDIDKTKQAKEWLKNKPLAFIENKGQFTNSDGNPADNVLFKASYGDCDIYITTEGISYVFVKYDKVKGQRIDTNDIHIKFGQKGMENKTVSYYRLDMNLQGSNISKTQIIKELPGKQGVTNYFYPNCPDGIYGVQEYGKITIKNIYKGIDWVIYTNAESREHPLKYDFLVHPHADYKNIKIKFVNAQSTLLTDNGTKLKIQTIAGNIEEGNLYSYLENSSEKQAIKTNYTANADSTMEFEIGAYDKTKTLVIDPLVWATYYGISDNEMFYSICTDSEDNVYLTGSAYSTDFPVQQLVGAYWQGINAVGLNAIILKFDNKGVRKWATFYGGSWEEVARCICADSQDNIYVTGGTSSLDFPTQQLAGAFYQSNNSGWVDMFILKFNNKGVRQWATRYGGSADEGGWSVCADSQNNIYIVGSTTSTDLPIKQLAGAYNQVTYGGETDTFILKFSAKGELIWSTYYGGNNMDYEYALMVDFYDNIYITGYTNSLDFPTKSTTGEYLQPNYAGGKYDAFLLKFNNQGAQQWATYYGGSDIDYGFALCTDKENNVYVTGSTVSTDFPIQQLPGAYNQLITTGIEDAFVLKFNDQGIRQWATYLGGDRDACGWAICSDKKNNIYVTGYTRSTNFPVLELKGEYWQETNGGGQDLFILKFNKQGIIKWSTYYGGEGYDVATSLKIDNQNSAYICGWVSSGGGAYTKDYGNGAYYDDTYNEGWDGLILKFELCNTQKPTSVQTSRDSICVNDNGIITLTAIGGVGDTLKWYSGGCGLNSIGKGTPLIIPSPTKTTMYYARWESLCDTTACDSVNVAVYSETKKSQNQKICQGNIYSIGHSTYTLAGTYTDTIPTISGCDSIITTNLTLYSIERTVQDTSICEGESFTFRNHSYTNTGTYQDTLTSVVYGCDSIITTNLNVNPTFLTPPQSHSICEGETFTVGTQIYSKAGIYTDVLKTYLNCDSTVITDLTVNPLPVVSLGDDRLICPGDTIILTPGDGYISYLWSDNTDLSQHIVTSPGIYSVTAYNDWCQASDEIAINECGTEIWFPNAFSPDNNSINERFKPVILGILNTYKILIYNRWGQLLYESNDAYSGWDGTFQGSLCANGQYVYIANYSLGAEAATQKQGIKRGMVTLLR